jgi:uncharacterized protein (DUF1697 family)
MRVMNSSDYIPVKKKVYIRKLVELEAENKALRKKIETYEEILKSKVKEKTHNVDVVEVHEYPDEIRGDAEMLFFKKDAYIYLKNPEKNEHLIPNIVKHIIEPHITPRIGKDDVESFLKYF